MKTYEIHHLDDNNEPMIVEAETQGKAVYSNYLSWREAFSGTFEAYLSRLIYCHAPIHSTNAPSRTRLHGTWNLTTHYTMHGRALQVSKRELSPKEYLSQALKLKYAIDDKHEQIEQLQTMARRATGTYEAMRVSGTKNHSRLEDAVVDIAAIGEDLGVLMSEFAAKYREISAVIDAVENPKYQRLLTLRYLRFMTWDEIALKMHYSRRNVLYMHGDALNEVCIVLHSNNRI